MNNITFRSNFIIWVFSSLRKLFQRSFLQLKSLVIDLLGVNILALVGNFARVGEVRLLLVHGHQVLVAVGHLREALQANVALVRLLPGVLSVVAAQVARLVKHLAAPLHVTNELALHPFRRLVVKHSDSVLVWRDI